MYTLEVKKTIHIMFILNLVFKSKTVERIVEIKGGETLSAKPNNSKVAIDILKLNERKRRVLGCRKLVF